MRTQGHNPLFVALAAEKPFEGFNGLKAVVMNRVSKSVDKEFGDKAYIKWNFTKFLIDREGNVVDRFAPQKSPESFEDAIKALL